MDPDDPSRVGAFEDDLNVAASAAASAVTAGTAASAFILFIVMTAASAFIVLIVMAAAMVAADMVFPVMMVMVVAVRTGRDQFALQISFHSRVRVSGSAGHNFNSG